jgi:hypothetical protein
MTSSICQSGTNALAIVQSAEPRSEANISVLRPKRSDTAAAQKIAKARKPVETESDKELAAGVMLKSCAKSGISGWTQ